MKIFTCVLLIATVLFLMTCKKDNGNSNSNTALTGKWKMSEGLADPGDGSGTWQPVSKEASQLYVQFDTNGKLEGTAFPNDVSYVVKDPVTLTFTSKDKVIQNYRYNINNGTLTMSPAGPIVCYEPCGTRYTKVK